MCNDLNARYVHVRTLLRAHAYASRGEKKGTERECFRGVYRDMYADVSAQIHQIRFLASDGTLLSKFAAILEADPNDDEFNGVKSAVD
jgi:hypothetical protein